jgi:hypothetical protein
MEENSMTKLLDEYKVKEVVYGHLHGPSHRYAVNGEYDGMIYRLVSADYLKFMPQKLRD